MNKVIIYVLISFAFLLLCQEQLSAQEYRSETRKGNKVFMDKGRYTEATTHYKAALKADSLYVPALYNMAYVLHNDRRDSLKNAQKDSLALQYLEKVAETIKGSEHEFDYYFNKGVICIDMKDWQGAVDAFKQCLKHTPGDMKALENYVYAKEHLQKDNQQQQQQDQQNQDQQQDQQQNQDNQDQKDQNQDQQQDQQQDQNDKNDQQNDKKEQDKNDQQNDKGDQDKKDQGGNQPNESKISQQAAQQMLQAIQDKEKKTQDKVNKKKAAVMQSKQKQKNW